MKVGEMRTVDVHARERWNDTGIEMVAGGRYLMTAEGTWLDWHTPAGPAGYPSPNLLFRLFAFRLRKRHANWFALMGAPDRDRARSFVIGAHHEYVCDRDSALSCFANDVSLMYFNNHGTVALTVKRTA